MVCLASVNTENQNDLFFTVNAAKRVIQEVALENGAPRGYRYAPDYAMSDGSAAIKNATLEALDPGADQGDGDNLSDTSDLDLSHPTDEATIVAAAITYLMCWWHMKKNIAGTGYRKLKRPPQTFPAGRACLSRPC